MKKNAAISLVATLLTTPTLATDYHYTSLESDFDRQIQPKNTAYAGLYLSMPFGQYKKNKNRFNYGLTVDFQHKSMMRNDYNFNVTPFATRRPFGSLSLVDINFNDQGFKRFSVAQLPLLSRSNEGQFVYLDDGEEKKSGSKVGKVLLWTGGILAATAGAGILLLKESIEFDFCQNLPCSPEPTE